MNTHLSSDPQEAAHLEKLRTQISTDIETMQQKEASLKEYEQRLRLLVEQAHHNAPAPNASQNHAVVAGSHSQAELDSEWEKYERAHALLEAARRGLSDDRLALKDREQRVAAREAEVARRESWLKTREQEAANADLAKVAAAAAAKAKPSFTTAPFLAAKNLFTPGKSS